MTTRKRTPGGIPASALAANISAGATSLTLTTGTGASWPSTFPFDIIINRASSTSRERITVGGRTTDTLNSLTRGIDGTTAQAHNLGDTVEVAVAGSYLDELGQLLGGTAGDLYYYDGTALQKLAKGTAEQMLKQGASAPAWSYTSIPTYADATTRDAEITAPAAGMAAYLQTGTRTEGLYFYNGTAWRPVAWNAPWGRIDSKAVVTNQTPITTVVDLTGLSITFTAVTRRIYRASWMTFPSSSVTTDTVATLLTDGSNTQRGQTQGPVTAAFTQAGFCEFSSVTGIALSAGSQTLKLRMVRNSGTGNITNNAFAGAASQLIIEDTGPDTGAPA